MRSRNTNLLELTAIHYGALVLEESLKGKLGAVLPDNATAVSFLQREGGTVSWTLNMEAPKSLQWIERGEQGHHSDTVCEGREQRVGRFSQQKGTSHHHRMDSSPATPSMQCSVEGVGISTCGSLCDRMNYTLPNLLSPFQDPMTVATVALLFSGTTTRNYLLFPPFCVINKLNRGQTDSVLALEGVVSRSHGAVHQHPQEDFLQEEIFSVCHTCSTAFTSISTPFSWQVEGD